jgi:hypothetical protein
MYTIVKDTTAKVTKKDSIENETSDNSLLPRELFMKLLPSNDRGTQVNPHTHVFNNCSFIACIRCRGNVFKKQPSYRLDQVVKSK